MEGSLVIEVLLDFVDQYCLTFLPLRLCVFAFILSVSAHAQGCRLPRRRRLG